MACVVSLPTACGGSRSGPPRPYEFADVVVPLELRAAYDDISSTPRFDSAQLAFANGQGLLHRRALAYIVAYDLFLLQQQDLNRPDGLSLFFSTDFSTDSRAAAVELSQQLAAEHGFTPPVAHGGFFDPGLSLLRYHLQLSPLVPMTLGELTALADQLVREHDDELAFALPAGIRQTGGHGQGGGSVL